MPMIRLYRSYISLVFQYDPIVPSQLNFKPRVDGRVLPDFPEVLFASDEYHQVAAMIGVVEDEWARSMGWFYRELNHDNMGTDKLHKSPNAA